MKLNKKWWLILGFGITAVVGVVLVLVLVVFNQDPEKPKTQYSIAIEVINPNFGVVTNSNASDVYYEGDNITFTFTPNETRCIESIYIDGENVFDYIADETIDVQLPFSYAFNNLSSNHTIKVKFDESMSIASLGYTTRQESGVADEVYGSIKLWGKSTVFPKSGRVRIQVLASKHYDFSSFILPSEREKQYSATEQYMYTDERTSQSINYDKESQSFILSSAFYKLDRKDGYDLELVFVPNTINLVIYVSYDGVSYTKALSEEVKLYTEYRLDSGYTWRYCLKDQVDISNTLPIDVIEEEVQGEVVEYVKLDHTLYVNNIDSKKIILVCKKIK